MEIDDEMLRGDRAKSQRRIEQAGGVPGWCQKRRPYNRNGDAAQDGPRGVSEELAPPWNAKAAKAAKNYHLFFAAFAASAFNRGICSRCVRNHTSQFLLQ